MAIRDINLIDSDILTRRYLLRHLALWAGCLIIALALTGGFYRFQLRSVSAQKSGRGSLQQMHANLEARINEIKNLQAELENLRRQQHALGSITPQQPFSRILVKLAGIMNPYTWITQLVLDSGAAKTPAVDLKLTGFSRSNEDLGDFINRLSNDAMFNAVVLQFVRENETAPSNQTAAETRSQIQFQITCTLARG